MHAAPRPRARAAARPRARGTSRSTTTSTSTVRSPRPRRRHCMGVDRRPDPMHSAAIDPSTLQARASKMRARTIMFALHTVPALLLPATAQELCRYANDGECDEPTYCSFGTDGTDCGGSAPGPPSAAASCAYANDGVCKSAGRVELPRSFTEPRPLASHMQRKLNLQPGIQVAQPT
eukprot:SAG22_NODE_176_length_16162_cov_30.625910_5_plen_177_part_00